MAFENKAEPWQSSADDYLCTIAPCDFLGKSLELLIPKNTGLTLRNVSRSRLENLFKELEFSSICFDGDMGMILDFLTFEACFLLPDYWRKFEHLLSNRPGCFSVGPYWSLTSLLDDMASYELLVTKILGITGLCFSAGSFCHRLELAEHTYILSGDNLSGEGLLPSVTIGKKSLSVLMKLERSESGCSSTF